MKIPTTKEVTPGATVNVVLKADQPTGRTVSGTVATVLTRGNHPRGIKVRLADGRVGRVQSMAGSGSTADAGSGSAAAMPTPARSRPEQDLPSQQIGLDAYITRPKRKGHGRGRGNRPDPEDVGEDPVSVVCPVCGEFTGDEAAVAHHVAGHFDGESAWTPEHVQCTLRDHRSNTKSRGRQLTTRNRGRDPIRTPTRNTLAL